MRKILAKANYIKTFKNHMSHFVIEEIITEQQAEIMLESFEKKKIKFISVVTIIGALLTGLGILLYIASNWDNIGVGSKVVLIFVGMIAFYLYGLKIEDEYRNTSKALIYISILIYGGGLFLIDQMFNLNIDIENHFLLWIIGIIPMMYVLKDYLIFLFVQLLGIFYVWLLLVERWGYDYQSASISIVVSILLLIVLIKYNEDRIKSKLSAFANNLMIILTLLFIMDSLDINPLFQVMVIFGFGLYVLYLPVFGKFADNLNYIQGTVIIGVTGVILTYENLWEEFSYIKDGTWLAISFGILFAVYLFWLTRKGNIGSLVFICVLILRYYTDTFYDFLPKSIFFIIGGLILIGFGFYLERLTRVKGGGLDVK